MPLDNVSGDLLVTNQLDIEIKVINNAQAWAEQVRGVYHLVYPHIANDFSHTKDIQEWVDQVFQFHTHGRPGCQGGTETLQVTGSPSQIPDTEGKGLIEDNSVLGKVRKGLRDLKKLVSGIDAVNNREL